MSIGIKQSLNLSQSLVMTPQLQQAIKLLQLSRMEMENLINTELVENPMLEESADSEASTQSLDAMREQEASAPDENPQAGDNFNWENYLESFKTSPGLPVYRGGDEDLPSYENTLTSATSLTEHLLWQLNLTDMTDAQKSIGELIIGNLNEDGYLQLSVEEIAQRENLDPHEVEAVLYRIQALDPVGVGARDLKECLLAQIYDGRHDDEMLERIVENHLGDLEKKNYQHVSKVLGISVDDVVERVRVIEELEPKPGRAFGGVPSHYIIPDIYVVKRGDEYAVMLNEDGLPKLKVSSFYKSFLEDKSVLKKDEAKEYVQGKLRAAVWLIRSIHQRQRTIYRVTESIVKQQREFFDKGIEHLRPMVLRDVANDIGMHESTISRVTTNKYVHTPRGIFELKFFFNSGISRVGGGDVASESVKEKVKAIIATEDPKRPHSDQKIAEMLLKDNINIARRTVAKYREMLGILPSSRRKKVF